MALQPGQVGSTAKNVFTPPSNVSVAKTSIAYIKRKAPANNTIVLPQAGFPYPSPYEPLRLASYPDGNSALAYLQSCGFTYQLGFSTTITISASPTSAIQSTSTGVWYLSWAGGLGALDGVISNGSPRGSILQGTSQGTIRAGGITINESGTQIAVFAVGNDTFNTTTGVSITIIEGGTAPDPKRSDAISVFGYHYYDEIDSSPQFTTSPDLLIIPIPDDAQYATNVSPTDAEIDLVAPTSADLQLDGSYNLTYPATVASGFFLPQNFMSIACSVTQGAVTGIYNGFTFSNDNLGQPTIIINVTNVSAAFTAAATVIKLDPLYDCSDTYKNTPCRAIGIDNNVITPPADFAALINKLTGIEQINNLKVNLQGYYSYQFANPKSMSIVDMVAPNTVKYVVTANNMVYSPFEYPCNSIILTARRMFSCVNNEIPYQATSGSSAGILGIAPPKSKASQAMATNEVLGQLFQQGICGLGVNNLGKCYMWNDICALQTIDGIPTTEFQYQSTQAKAAWVNLVCFTAGNRETLDFSTNPPTRKNNTDAVLNNINSAVLAQLTNGYRLGMLGKTNNSVITTLDPLDPTRVICNVTTTLVTPNNGIDYTFTFLPYTLPTN